MDETRGLGYFRSTEEEAEEEEEDEENTKGGTGWRCRESLTALQTQMGRSAESRREGSISKTRELRRSPRLSQTGLREWHEGVALPVWMRTRASRCETANTQMIHAQTHAHTRHQA